MSGNFSVMSSKSRWRPSKSFWITVAIWLLVLIIALPSVGFIGWLVLFALFLVISALYSLITGRPSWLGLPRRKSAGAAVGVGLVALIAGGMMLPATEPAPTAIAPLAEVNAAVTTSATPSPSPTPSPAPKYVLLEKCVENGESVVEGSDTFVCTLDDEGVLVWMGESDSQKLVAQRAEEKRVEVKRVADEKVAAQKAATEKVAAEKAATEKAAAQEAAAAKAAADETARVAAEQAAQKAAQEQAAQEQAPAIQPLVEVPAAVYYANCTEAKAAGAAPLYRGDPGYRSKMDGDSDGVACER